MRHAASLDLYAMALHPLDDEAVDVGTLYRAHAPYVWRIVASLGAPEADREDLVQQVFEIAHRKIDDLRPDVAPRAWLFSIARHTTVNHVRTKSRRAAKLKVMHDGRAPTDPEALRDRADRARLVEEFLASLPRGQRVAFELVEVGGLSGPEVAEATGTKLNTVYTRLRAARAAFRKHVESLIDRGAVG